MKVTKIYTKKEYTCKKCDGQVYYGQITDDVGKTITKDGGVPNGKYGKESNILSGAVEVNNKAKFHECYLSNLQKQYRDATELYQEERPIINNMPSTSKDIIGEFLVEANNFYQRGSPTAAKFCGAGATVKDVHITLMGMMHDFFLYKTSKE